MCQGLDDGSIISSDVSSGKSGRERPDQASLCPFFHTLALQMPSKGTNDTRLTWKSCIAESYILIRSLSSHAPPAELPNESMTVGRGLEVEDAIVRGWYELLCLGRDLGRVVVDKEAQAVMPTC